MIRQVVGYAVDMKTLSLVLWIILYGMNGKQVEATDQIGNKSRTNDCQASPGNICLDETYNKLEIPNRPVRVESWIWVVQITEVDYDQNTVAITAMLTFGWQDNRIQNRRDANDTMQCLDRVWLGKIWYPSFFIRGLTDIKIFKAAGEHCTGVNLNIRPVLFNS